MKNSQIMMLFFLELYQFFCLFFKTLIRWRNLVLEFTFKVICRIWMFIGESKHFMLNGYWWRISQCIMIFFLELYQSFFFTPNLFIIWWSPSLEFSLKMIFRRWIFIDESKHLTLNGYWWKISQLIMMFFLEIYPFMVFFSNQL